MWVNITILIYIMPIFTEGIKVYKSTLTLADRTKPIGLHYTKTRSQQNFRFTHSVTFCARFNYQRLGKEEDQSSRIFDIKGPTYDAALSFLWLNARYPETWFGFGNYGRANSYSNWILFEPLTREFRYFFEFSLIFREFVQVIISLHSLWKTSKWTHVCLSFDKDKSHIALAKDGKITNINFVDERLRNVMLPLDFLDMIYVGRCWDDEIYSLHNGEITDVNIWNRALSLDEILGWTDCRY